ncbi:beta-ketoacyl synthase N-terminal-like domain-containing protein [Massilia sp. NR 4-1]|uniref:beta-ketoacyl synthase N-terminal-like domain-containing protein n=1 Tax=Massilia sp. NR 4-1 TaxID=1678028 RepID=UPI00067AB1DB|nr:beta-ketoacyl synthase N-terminal-like domain-containing protein [Massilia sp. NR 4-1]AKU21009.1 polyketide beta-ketoacyl:ACP synthase [Massilia sp. NR 4-1]
MKSWPMHKALISGIGVVSAIGVGRAAFADALWQGRSNFGVMRRPGRQSAESAFLGAEIAALPALRNGRGQPYRKLSLSTHAALATADEAWADAGLAALDPQRVGLVLGGSNLQQRAALLALDPVRDQPWYTPPHYAASYCDSDIAAWCAEHLGLQGPVWTAGAASASGLLAVVEAARAVLSGELDACIAVGGLSDLSHLECQAFRSLGAMGSANYADQPQRACRPFDTARDGFIYGEACAALVVESVESAQRRGASAYMAINGWSAVSDASRQPHPSQQGEMRAVGQALAHAGWRASEIDYVNPHGSGSPLGDETELAALRASGLGDAWINTTKSLAGHGLTAAGALETVALALQMREQRLHPCANLEQPIGSARWVPAQGSPARIGKALKLSMGFGGINIAMCFQHPSQFN